MRLRRDSCAHEQNTLAITLADTRACAHTDTRPDAHANADANADANDPFANDRCAVGCALP